MLLHQIASRFNKVAAPRVGRGGKRGTTSGRGQKGQRAHAGRRIRPAERDLIQRLPKLRGRGTHAHKPRRPKPRVINLKDWGKVKEIPRGVKILAVGEIRVAVHLKGVMASKTAREKIEKAGGTITNEKLKAKS